MFYQFLFSFNFQNFTTAQQWLSVYDKASANKIEQLFSTRSVQFMRNKFNNDYHNKEETF